jgi:hypothetical protein
VARGKAHTADVADLRGSRRAIARANGKGYAPAAAVRTKPRSPVAPNAPALAVLDASWYHNGGTLRGPAQQVQRQY